MDKETLLQTYIDIETKTYVRADKNKKLNDFIASIKAKECNLALVDTLWIVEQLFKEKITLRHPFFLHIIYPVLSEGVEHDNFSAIKQLLKLFNYYGNFQNLTDDNKHTIWTLLTKGLQLFPFDKELLSDYEQRRGSYFDYTLHELPSGVLYGSDGATIDQCNELLQDLTDYENVCKKLNLDRQELISDCKFYYNAYKSYLAVFKNYHGFADYLNKHGIIDT